MEHVQFHMLLRIENSTVNSSQRTSLAQRAAAGQVQARHHDVSLPASLSSTVPVRLLHAGRERRRL